MKSGVNESSFGAAQRRRLARISHQLLMSSDRSPSQLHLKCGLSETRAPKQMDPISTTLCRRARVAQAAGAYPGFDEPMSRFSLLGAGFTDPEISPADRPECRDRPTGEISGLARRRLPVAMAKAQRKRIGDMLPRSEAEPR